MIEWMPHRISRRHALGVLVGSTCASLSGLSLATARTASAWSEASHSRLRLIRASGGKNGEYQAGIALEMTQGYKTYWRHPGDSGVPPVFRFDGSQNVKEAIVHFPAPKRFADGAGGFSIGYAEPAVILPMTVTAMNPREPVILKMEADYAVCEKMCVPAHGQASLELSAASSTHTFNDLLKQAMDRVPRARKLGEAGTVAIKALIKGSEPEHFIVETMISNAAHSDLFIEGASPWFFEVKAADKGRFPVLVVDKDKSPDCAGADITLTLVAGDQAIEVRTRLDMALIAS